MLMLAHLRAFYLPQPLNFPDQAPRDDVGQEMDAQNAEYEQALAVDLAANTDAVMVAVQAESLAADTDATTNSHMRDGSSPGLQPSLAAQRATAAAAEPVPQPSLEAQRANAAAAALARIEAAGNAWPPMSQADLAAADHAECEEIEQEQVATADLAAAEGADLSAEPRTDGTAEDAASGDAAGDDESIEPLSPVSPMFITEEPAERTSSMTRADLRGEGPPPVMVSARAARIAARGARAAFGAGSG